MSNLRSTTKLHDLNLSVRAMNVIQHVFLFRVDITLATILDEKRFIFANPKCTELTKKEILHLIFDYMLET